MINHADIENIIGCKTLVTDRMQRAIEEWYDAAIDGLPLDKNPETLTLDLPALICAELARLTTLELEATVEGSDRADWINAQLQRALTPRRRRIFTVALALGSGIWKPYQSGKKLGITFCNASRYFPVAHDVEGNLTEGVFIDTIQDDDNYYHRLEWMHVLERRQDLRDAELEQLEDYKAPGGGKAYIFRETIPGCGNRYRALFCEGPVVVQLDLSIMTDGSLVGGISDADALAYLYSAVDSYGL